MRQFSIYAAATLVFAVLAASAPAMADWQSGAPIKTGSQCWKASVNWGGNGGGTYGYWGACPAPAAAAVAPRHHRRHNA